MAHIGPSPTAQAIYSLYERRAEDWRRAHLGASSIGEPCRRKLWYDFRWACKPEFPGRLLRLFERGDREEAWLIENLRDAGMLVTGEQLRFASIHGHFGGSCDGMVLGVPGCEKSWHLFEAKTYNEKRFRTLVASGVEKSDPKYFAQCQVYMRKFSLERTLFVAVNKNNDEIHTERFKLNIKLADQLEQKAEDIISANEPPERISDDPAWYECKLCHHAGHCHSGDAATLERNCRTCLHSSPADRDWHIDGAWHCDVYNEEMTSIDKQRRGCDKRHLFIPGMLGKAIDAGGYGEGEWVKYEDGRVDQGMEVKK